MTEHPNIEKILHPPEEVKMQKDFYVKLRNTPDTEEKIDYIYKTLKRQRRFAFVKIFFRILLIVLVLYVLFYMPPETKGKMLQQFQDILVERISKISQPIVDESLKNMTEQSSQENIDVLLENKRIHELMDQYKNASWEEENISN